MLLRSSEMTRLWPVFALFCACGGTTIGHEPPAPVPPPAPDAGPKLAVEAPEMTSSPQALAKPPPLQIVGNELANAGWSCWPREAEIPTLDCPKDAAHPTPMRVTYSTHDDGCTADAPCVLRLTSYDAPRAFGKSCEKFAQAMTDLANASHRFSVTCNDTTNEPLTSQEFGFVTTIVVTDPNASGIVVALPTHDADRANAIRKLTSIKAIDPLKSP